MCVLQECRQSPSTTDNKCWDGLVGYDAALTRLRSRVQFPLRVHFCFCLSPHNSSTLQLFSLRLLSSTVTLCRPFLLFPHRKSPNPFTNSATLYSTWHVIATTFVSFILIVNLPSNIVYVISK